MRSVSLPVSLSESDRLFVEQCFVGKQAATRRAYGRDLARFAVWFCPDVPPEIPTNMRVQYAAAHFLRHEAPQAHGIGWNYRGALMEAGLGPATINRRLSAVRALCRRARQTGRISWLLDVPGLEPPPARVYTVGPDDVARLIEVLLAAPPHAEPQKIRDACAVRLSWDLALQRSELLAIDLEDVNLIEGTIRIRKKGKTEKKTLTLPRLSIAAIGRWLDEREALGTAGEPALFVHFGPGAYLRLSGRGWCATLVRRTKRILGRAVTPHVLRHAAIRCAPERTGSNVARVAGSEHEDIRTTIPYDDMRRNDPG